MNLVQGSPPPVITWMRRGDTEYWVGNARAPLAALAGMALPNDGETYVHAVTVGVTF